MRRSVLLVSILFFLLPMASFAADKVVVIPLNTSQETISWKNTWAEGTNYNVNDLVQIGGSSYICIKQHTASSSNQPPVGSEWNLLASIGDTGPPGTLSIDPLFQPVGDGVLTCSTDLMSEDTITGRNRIGGTCDNGQCYKCGVPNPNLEQTGPENIYSFQCQASGPVTVTLELTDCDLDLYVLEYLSIVALGGSTQCLSGSTDTSLITSATFPCQKGSLYYVVLENYFADLCSFNLGFDVGAGQGCEEDCNNFIDDDGDSFVDCVDSSCADDPVCL